MKQTIQDPKQDVNKNGDANKKGNLPEYKDKPEDTTQSGQGDFKFKSKPDTISSAQTKTDQNKTDTMTKEPPSVTPMEKAQDDDYKNDPKASEVKSEVTSEVKAQTITKEELLAKIKVNQRVQIVNVLSPDHYTKGFIKGSIKIPLDQLDQRMSELDKSIDVVTYCASSECNASMKAAQKLAAKGFMVKAYEGGIKEWSQAGLPKD